MRAFAPRPWICAALLLSAPLCACGERDASPSRPRASAPASRPEPRAGAPNVLLIVIDTLRADMLDPDDPEAAAMPALSRLAADSVFAEQAASASSWTPPSLASLLTGLLPERSGGLDELRTGRGLRGAVTLAGLLRDSQGYRCAARFGGLTPQDVAKLGQDFDVVSNDFRLRAGAGSAVRWAQDGGGQPWMQLLHTYEAHDPYGADNHPLGEPAPSARALREILALGPDVSGEELVRRYYLDVTQRLMLNTHPLLREQKRRMVGYVWSGLTQGASAPLAQELAAAYREGARWVDGLLEGVLGTFAREGLLADTLLIVTSDHGEAFGEHGMLGHGRRLDDELVRVPLLLRGPPPFDRPLRLSGSLGLVDLLPTIAQWTRATVPPGLDGVSFLGELEGGGPERPVISQVVREGGHTDGLSEALVVSVRSSTWKYVAEFDRRAGTLHESAFDLRRDPQEQHDLAGGGGLVADLIFDDAFCRCVQQARAWILDRAAHGASERPVPATPVDLAPFCEARR